MSSFSNPGIFPSFPTLTIYAAGCSTGDLALVTQIPKGSLNFVAPFFLLKIIFK